MKTLTDPRAQRTVLGIGTMAILAFASVAGAMQEYEDIKTLVAEIETDIAKAEREIDDLEDIGILLFIFGTEDLSEIQTHVDRLAYQAVSVLSALAAQADREGNEAAGTRVRRQMQKIKQAAQQVRNRILEIRSASSIDICVIPVHMEIGMYMAIRPRANRRSTVKAQDL